MIRMDCEHCGGTLKRRGNTYECEFCGSQFVMNENDRLESSIVIDAKLLNLYIKASGFMLKGNYAEELGVLTEALELDDSNATTLVKMGRCYRNLGCKTQAIEMYKEALRIDPSDGVAYTNLGAICILDKDWNNAMGYYEKGLPLIDQSTEDYWISYANYAICVAQTGNPIKASKMIIDAERHGYKTGDKCREMAGLI